MLYSYINRYPEKLPKRFRLGDGSTITNLAEKSSEELLELGFDGPYEIPVYDPSNEKINWNGSGFDIIPFSEDEKNGRIAEIWRNVRNRREELLSKTDWAVLPDSQLSEEKKNEFLSYRQKLRNIPQEFSDPSQIIWPQEPQPIDLPY